MMWINYIGDDHIYFTAQDKQLYRCDHQRNNTALTGISLLSGKILNTMAIVEVVTLMPYLLRSFGLNVAQYFDFTYLLDGTEFLTMAASSVIYMTLTSVVLAAALSALTWFAKRGWIGSVKH